MFCSHCGAEIHPEAAICVKCGCWVSRPAPAPLPVPVQPAKKDDTMAMVIKIFMVIGCICTSLCMLLIPLAWCIPMTVSVFRSLDEGRPISTGMKICSLLFVNTIAGVCMLLMDE